MPKKMKELASYYIEAIRDTEVRQHFVTIAGKVKTNKHKERERERNKHTEREIKKEK